MKIMQQKINRSYLIYFTLLSLTFFSLLTPLPVNKLDIKLYMTILLIIMFSLSLNKINKNIIIELYFILLYVFYALFYLIFDESINYKDFIIVFLPFFYSIILSFFAGKSFLSIQRYKKIFFYISAAFLIRYLVLVLFNITSRPTLFLENNFEIMFLILIYIGYCHIENNVKLKKIYTVLILTIVLLSGSRSGIVSFLVVILVLNIRFKFNIRDISLIFIIFLLFVLFISVFLFRTDGGLNSIDRVQFLFYFLNEINDWSFWQYLFGNPIITPLSYNTVSHFSYFHNLMSYKHDGTAYSILFHAFDLRVIFDHGIIGLFFIFYFINKILIISRYNLRERISILSLFFLNGLSVSSFGNIMGIIGLFLIIIIKKEKYEN